MRTTFLHILFWLIGVSAPCIIAQSNHQNTKRYEIDAKRIGVGYLSRDALPRGREFKQIDSTYYVGWMYEGAYQMDHAADALGYRLAAETLQHAQDLLERDFKRELTTRTSDPMQYINMMGIHRDWDFIQYALYQSYAYSNQINKAWQNLRLSTKFNLQDELLTETYNLMAWTVHRYRQYTSSTYGFLKNTIAENEKYAHALLDSSLQKIIRDQALMSSFLAINYRQEREPGIWHYRAILYGYDLNIPKAATCYEQLKNTAYFPENNYATFNLIQGLFKEAAIHYEKAKEQETGDKRLQESYYYSSILNLYQNNIPSSINEINRLIEANGSTPGFGWYHLALARLYLYNGQIHQASLALNKASNFQEIHMGTTLGESHYQFTLSTLQLVRYNRLIQLQHQADNYWWIKPDKLWQSIVWYWKRYKEKLRWIDILKNNPERQQVIYNLFSTESTISFDEVINCVDGLSPNYFSTFFSKKLNSDSLRPALKPYWLYATAKQLIKDDQWLSAEKQLFQAINILTKTNNTYHQILIARCYEALIQCYLAQNKQAPSSFYLNWFTRYPQSIMASNIPFPIQIQHDNSPELAPLLKAIQRSNLIISTDANHPTLKLQRNIQGIDTTIVGHWILPKSSTPYRTCKWSNLSTTTANETIFQPLFQLKP